MDLKSQTLFNFNMVLECRTAKEADFIDSLQKLHKDICRFPQTSISIGFSPIREKLNRLFEVHIRVENLNEGDIDKILKTVDDLNLHFRLKSLIMTKILLKLDDMDDYEIKKLRQKTIDKHFFKMN